MSSLIQAFLDGGIFMYPILLAGLIAVGISIDRYRFLFRSEMVRPNGIWTKAKELLRVSQVGDAVALSSAQSSFEGRIVEAGLSRASRDEQQVQNAVDVETLRILPKVQSKLSYLTLIANLATLIGLLGTISGLIQAFAAVASADPSQKQTLLAQGISIAMNTTAFGLMVAIPTMAAHGWLSSQAKRVISHLTQLSTEVVDELSGRIYVMLQGDQKAPTVSVQGNKVVSSEAPTASM